MFEYLQIFYCDFLQESRMLKFWFAYDTVYLDKVTSAYEFFKELVRPDQFPRGNTDQLQTYSVQTDNKTGHIAI